MYNGVKVLDVHGHVSAPAGGQSYLVSMLASNTATPSPLSAGRGGPARPGMSDEDFQRTAAEHAAYMDARNIDVQIIGPRPFMMMGWMEDHLLPHWSQYVNDTIHKQVQAFPTRFAGAAQLPQNSAADDLSHVIPELERCVSEYGFIAAYASPDPGGRRTTPGMHEPYWFPLYERCQALGIPLIVHGTNGLDKRYRIAPQNYQLAFLTEQYLAGQFLSHGDVFERYPELKVVICHCGGALDRFIPTDSHIAQKDLSKNLFYDSCGYDLNFLEAAIKQRGPARMCFGTEAPGSGRAVRPETGKTSDDLVPVISSFPFLSEDDKLTIFNKNPAKVFPALVKM
ncbi:MAG: amidohydrolase family protein [Dehalococcoidia bacterium]